MSLVSDVRIFILKSRNGELVAFADFTVGDAIRCKTVAIVRRPNGGYRLSYPTRRFGDKRENYFAPITLDIGLEIERAVLAEYKRILGRLTENG